MFSTINPSNLTFLAQHQYFTDVETTKRIENAANSFKKWQILSIENRAKFIKSLINALTKQQHLLAETAALEMGKPIKEAIAELNKCSMLCEYYIKHSPVFLKSEFIKTDAKESFITYEPLGVILGVMPWNFPYWQVFRFAIPAILAGNTVLVKHASNVAGCAKLIEKLFIEVGFPENIYQNLLISGDQVKKVIENPAIKAVSVTGSEKAGSQVASTAAKHIKKAVLELGGSNAFIVCQDADLEECVKTAIKARMQNSGQSCIAAKRFLVHKSIYTTFLENFKEGISKLKMGDPMNEDTDIGPLARIDLAEEIEAQVKKSVKMGARIIIGGKRNNAFYEPTLLADVTPEMPAFKEELFGPVAAVTPFDDFEDAVRLSNSTEFGLGVSVFTKDIEFVKSKIHLFEEGAVFINAMVKSDPRLPFGGIKKSGFGRELAENGIKEFVNIKTVYINN